MISAVQSMAVPICAPAMEYVAMPEGSSSAAPVINPGPSSEKNFLMEFRLPEAVFFGMAESFSTCFLRLGNTLKRFCVVSQTSPNF